MEKVRAYKRKDGAPDRSMLVNDSEDARIALEADGWSFKKPTKFKEPEAAAEETIESLKEQVSDLTSTLEGKAEEILELIAKIEELRQGGDSEKGPEGDPD